MYFFYIFKKNFFSSEITENGCLMNFQDTANIVAIKNSFSKILVRVFSIRSSIQINGFFYMNQMNGSSGFLHLIIAKYGFFVLFNNNFYENVILCK